MNLGKYIDHTCLKVDATIKDIQKLAQEALDYKFASICIPQTFVQRINNEFKDLTICTVVGFPQGNSCAKEYETEIALRNGATEIDMVIDISRFKDKDFSYIEGEIKALKKICGNHILKVIIETAFLSQEEIKNLTQITVQANADYIKTSTGFASRGASFDDIAAMKGIISEEKSNLKIKASGGIRDKETALKYISLGASRLGTSSGVKILG